PTDTPTPTPTCPPNTAPVLVTIQDGNFDANSYSPNPVTVNVGQTVTWLNAGPSSHTSTSDASLWDSGVLNPGDSFSFQFNTPGTYAYHCSIHHSMTGTVIVNPGCA